MKIGPFRIRRRPVRRPEEVDLRVRFLEGGKVLFIFPPEATAGQIERVRTLFREDPAGETR